MKSNIPIRMCIVCKKRIEQNKMYRFKIKSFYIVKYDKCGRSYYICKDCIDENDKILQKAFLKIFKNLNMQITSKILKEIFLNVKS